MSVRIFLMGVAAAVISAIVGSWSLALETLGIVMLLDYATGLIVAGVFHASPKSAGGALESKAAFKGLIRKVGIVVIVIAFHQLDRLTGKTFFRDGAAWAFFVEEFLSVIENLGLMGLPMPKFVIKAVEWLRNKGDALADAIPDGKPPDGETQQEDETPLIRPSVRTGAPSPQGEGFTGDGGPEDSAPTDKEGE